MGRSCEVRTHRSLHFRTESLGFWPAFFDALRTRVGTLQQVEGCEVTGENLLEVLIEIILGRGALERKPQRLGIKKT